MDVACDRREAATKGRWARDVERAADSGDVRVLRPSAQQEVAVSRAGAHPWRNDVETQVTTHRLRFHGSGVAGNCNRPGNGVEPPRDVGGADVGARRFHQKLGPPGHLQDQIDGHRLRGIGDVFDAELDPARRTAEEEPHSGRDTSAEHERIAVPADDAEGSRGIVHLHRRRRLDGDGA